MSLASQLISSGDFIFYSPKLLQIIDDHVDFFREHPKTQRLLPSADVTNLYNRDVLGLLGAYGVRPEYKLIVMKTNRIGSTTDDVSLLKEILVPDQGVVMKIINSFNSTFGA